MSDHSADEQIKTVYAQFGLALYLAQVLEHGLANALIYSDLIPGRAGKPIARPAWEAEFDTFLNLQFEKTLGRLITSLKSATSISDELEGVLKKALEARNFLSHHYFRERAELFLSRDGRDQMIEELERYQKLFDDADERLTKALYPFREKYNLTEEQLKPHYDKYVEKFVNDL